jgi:hypothetical protein
MSILLDAAARRAMFNLLEHGVGVDGPSRTISHCLRFSARVSSSATGKRNQLQVQAHAQTAFERFASAQVGPQDAR